MTRNFNIRDNLWNPLYPHHSSLSNNLFIITDSFNLGLSIPTNQVLTRYSDNCHEANSIIDLMFLYCGSSEMDNHTIHPDWRLTSDHASLTIVIPIVEEHVQTKSTLSSRTATKNMLLSRNLLKHLETSTHLTLLISLVLIELLTNFPAL